MAFSKPLLKLLSSGQFHSGTELGAALGCSRAAVWKMIQSLEERGVDIFHVRGKGYRLSEPVELLETESILAAVPADRRCDLSAVDVFFEIDSTNAYLMGQPLDSTGTARACFAEYQNSGRGRRGRTWVSPFGGNLYLSLRWRFSCGVSRLGGLSLAVGVALCKALEAMGARSLQLKWPNDILVEKKKLAGVLLEVSGESNGPCEVVIGVGVNVCCIASAKAHIDQPWTDLQSCTLNPVARNRLAGRVLGELIAAARSYDALGFDAFREAWKDRDVFAGQRVVLHSLAGDVVGIARGVDDMGALLLELPDGELKSFHAGEVSLRAAEGAKPHG